MNPLSITARNLRSYPALDFAIPEGVCAITGPNGAGKSTLLGAIELALFADGARDLAPALGPFAERLELELDFEHAGETYHIKRSYSGAGRGKATLDLERTFSENGYRHQESLTAESAAATQARINALLGLDRATFNASAYIAQGNSAAFCEAAPSERKAILGRILDPAGLWPALAERARGEAKAAEAEIAGTQARLADREQQAAEVPELGRAADVAKIAEQQARAAQTEAEQKYEMAQLRVHEQQAAQERARAAQQALGSAQAAAGRAADAIREAEAQAAQVADLDAAIASVDRAAASIPALERAAEERRTAALRFEAARREKEQADAAEAAQRKQALAAQGDETTALEALRASNERLNHLRDAEPCTERCDRCAQLLGKEARQAALVSLEREAALLAEVLRGKQQAREDANYVLLRMEEAGAAILIPDVPPRNAASEAAQELADAREQAERRSGLAERLARTEAAREQLPSLRQWLKDAQAEEAAQAALSAAAHASLADSAALAAKANGARVALQVAQARQNAATVQRARAEQTFAQAQAAAEEARELRRALGERHAALDVLRLAERACGRDGIPAWVAENSCGAIEAEANRILERLPCASGALLRLELRTQKALKSDAGAVRETLDIMVADSQSTREFLTYSGGERWRVSFALRWALARLLAGRRGAESRLLVIDEPDGLDAGGMDALAALLAEERAFSKVLLVSHQPVLASAFEQVVEIRSDGEVSRLVGASEMEISVA